MRFNYLHDAPPEALERLRPSRIPERLRTPLAALVTACIVVSAWWGIEQLALAHARSQLAQQRLRFDETRAELKELDLHKDQTQKLLAFDARLREIRLSGTRAAALLADIANHVPGRVWLTSVSRVEDALEVDGRALGFTGLSALLTQLGSNVSLRAPRLTHAAQDSRDAAVIAFAMRMEMR